MIKMLVEDFRRLVGSRCLAYQKTFDLKSAYAQQVLGDLSKFCRAHDSTFHKDARAHAVLEGRREVWLRIQEHLNLNENQIYQLHRVHEILPAKEQTWENA